MSDNPNMIAIHLPHRIWVVVDNTENRQIIHKWAEEAGFILEPDDIPDGDACGGVIIILSGKWTCTRQCLFLEDLLIKDAKKVPFPKLPFKPNIAVGSLPNFNPFNKSEEVKKLRTRSSQGTSKHATS